jgi:hypothetical protein
MDEHGMFDWEHWDSKQAFDEESAILDMLEEEEEEEEEEGEE